MYYYTVPTIGSGKTHDDPIRPDIDKGTAFVGEIGSDGNFIIATFEPLTVKAERVQLSATKAIQDTCAEKGINCDDVINKWFVKGG